MSRFTACYFEPYCDVPLSMNAESKDKTVLGPCGYCGARAVGRSTSEAIDRFNRNRRRKHLTASIVSESIKAFYGAV